jgi:biofilm PGA synthesis N-glycosyltransferase PgaC
MTEFWRFATLPLSLTIAEYWLGFLFFYPLFMAMLWLVGGLYYYVRWEMWSGDARFPPGLTETPLVSIIVPCFNEGDNVIETIGALMRQNYPNFEVIAVNDGSKDNTGKLLDDLQSRYDNLRVVHFAKNQGKAIGLRMGTLAARGEFLVCIDGDAYLDKNCTAWLVKCFEGRPRLGAVTGNPRIRNRSTLLGKIQVGEFSSIIGLIKRTQRVYGRIFTISGVVAAFRKSALHDVGYWSVDMITEDIDITWKLHIRSWEIEYQPNAMCWILMPETLKGLWRQRLRWAQGGSETVLRYYWIFGRPRLWRLWPLLTEYCMSLVWSYGYCLAILLWAVGQFVPMPGGLNVPDLLPAFWGIVLGTTCMLQFSVSLWIDSRYEDDLAKNYFWVIWYFMVYWMINIATSVVGFPKAIMKKKGQRATWVSPDRGIYRT